MLETEGRFVGVSDRYWYQGFTEGFVESYAKACAQSFGNTYDECYTEGQIKVVLKIFAMRHMAVPDDVRDRVLACTDTEELDELLKRAVTVTTARELLD